MNLNTITGSASLWQYYKRVPEWVLPYSKRQWVLDKGSLTKRLQDASKGDFAVRVTHQGWMYPHLDEIRHLGIPCRQKALIREVELICLGEIWVRARSIIPVDTLSGKERELRVLGNRPLGAYLFKSKSMQRHKLELAAFHLKDEGKVYGRRSIFCLSGKPLLVSELFMPALFEKTILKHSVINKKI